MGIESTGVSYGINICDARPQEGWMDAVKKFRGVVDMEISV